MLRFQVCAKEPRFCSSDVKLGSSNVLSKHTIYHLRFPAPDTTSSSFRQASLNNVPSLGHRVFRDTYSKYNREYQIDSGSLLPGFVSFLLSYQVLKLQILSTHFLSLSEDYCKNQNNPFELKCRLWHVNKRYIHEPYLLFPHINLINKHIHVILIYYLYPQRE